MNLPEVKGSIQFLGMLELLQIAGFNHRDMVIAINNAAGSGHLVMKDGSVIDAALGQQRGVGALFPLLQGCSEGEFQLLPPPKEWPQQTITLKIGQILMRAAMAMPQPGEVQTFNPQWQVDGSCDLLSVEELLQIFESNKKAADCSFNSESDELFSVSIAEGGVLDAKGAGSGASETIYELLKRDRLRFSLSSPSSAPKVEKMIDIAGLVMEGLRRRDEDTMLRKELNIEHNEHARETLELLDAGELDEQARIQIARRYLPGGEIAPAALVARLAVDKSKSVRDAALETIQSLPEPIVEAMANDPDTPAPLLTYFMEVHGSDLAAAAAVTNPATPLNALIAFAPIAKRESLSAFTKLDELLRTDRELRSALKSNPKCAFGELLDKLDAMAAPRMRKRTFTAFIPKPSEADSIVLEKPEIDPRKEKPGEGKLTPRDIQYLAKRGTLRQKMDLVCGNDDGVAEEIVAQPGVPESFILGVAETTAANTAALRYIGSHRAFRRNSNIVNALMFNPKTPVATASGLMSQIRPDTLLKISGSRDLPDGTRQIARQNYEKRQKQPKK